MVTRGSATRRHRGRARTWRSSRRRIADPSQKPWKPVRGREGAFSSVQQQGTDGLRIDACIRRAAHLRCPPNSLLSSPASAAISTQYNGEPRRTRSTAHSRLCSGSRRSEMTTWSAFGIRCTFMSSARSRARWMSTFANVLWPPFRCLSAIQRGCSENFAPHAMTVATNLVEDQHPRPERGAGGWRRAPGRANPGANVQ